MRSACLLSVLSLLTFSHLSVSGQTALPGTAAVLLLTKVGTEVDAPVFLPDGRGAGYVPGMVAQLFLVTSDGLVPLESATTFRSAPVPVGLAYVVQAEVKVPQLEIRDSGTFRFRAWESTKGVTYEEARDNGGWYGESEITAQTGGGMLAPGNLVGLPGFILTRRETLVVDNLDSDQLNLYLDNAQDRTYTLEVSSDLIHWTPWQTFQAKGGDAITFPIAGGNQFIRAVLQD